MKRATRGCAAVVAFYALCAGAVNANEPAYTDDYQYGYAGDDEPRRQKSARSDPDSEDRLKSWEEVAPNDWSRDPDADYARPIEQEPDYLPPSRYRYTGPTMVFRPYPQKRFAIGPDEQNKYTGELMVKDVKRAESASVGLLLLIAGGSIAALIVLAKIFSSQ
ncbi:MAG: hypothetical protein HYV63_21400 [Candidatus Schekmanbacteria bacterium]|nr:hypothetical protein [Candidatus Schekmanbacteria bacterium]